MSSKGQQRERKADYRGASSEGVGLPMNLLKSLRRKATNNNGSEGGSSSSNVEGNNSDNSALVSLGNTSFGFNFDSEEGNSSPPNSERNGESDSDGGNGNSTPKRKSNNRSDDDQKQQQRKEKTRRGGMNESEANRRGGSSNGNNTNTSHDERPSDDAPHHDMDRKSSSSLTQEFSSSSLSDGPGTSSHNMAADAAVANLYSIASAYMSQHQKEDDKKPSPSSKGRMDNDSNGGYNTDDEGARGFDKITRHPDQAASSSANLNSSNGSLDNNNDDDDDDDNDDMDNQNDDRPRKKKRLNSKKREERNAREKERSFRISKQINELRALLSSGGVIVPKGTKSSVLTEAANYIRMLQQHQYRSEIDRHQLVQQIQMIGGGAHGPQAAQAIRHVAAANGVWSLGNFGGVPPKSAMAVYEPNSMGKSNEMQQPFDPMQQTKIEEHEYRAVFHNNAVGMAIASMGGAFIDCNQLFCRLSNYSKQEVCSLTIFNLTARQDLQHAFDLISHLISPPMDAQNSGAPQPIVLRGAMNNRNDLGLGVALVKGTDGIAKFFCVTLIKNPASPFDDAKPIPATIELIQGTPSITRRAPPKDAAGLDSAPAFTTG